MWSLWQAALFLYQYIVSQQPPCGCDLSEIHSVCHITGEILQPYKKIWLELVYAYNNEQHFLISQCYVENAVLQHSSI